MKTIKEDESFADGLWLGAIFAVFITIIAMSFVREDEAINDNQSSRNTPSVRN
jgi:hypothetical protein